MHYRKELNKAEFENLLDELAILNLHAEEIKASEPRKKILQKIQELYILILSYLD
jgi:hypothetical protein